MKLFLVAGFDFGTSYSKVVLRDFLNEKLAKAVTFGTAASGLMPSYVRVSKGLVSGPTGSCEKGLMLSYPKLIAADVSTSSSQFNDLYGNILKDLLGHLGVATLSDAVPLILTRYFLSILDSIHDFIRKDVDWNCFDPSFDELVVQVAVPTGLMADRDAKLASLIQESLVAATYMRRGDRKPSPKSTVDEIQRALDTVRLLDSMSRKELDGRCVTYPEVAAGVQTLLRSKNTPDGKYITLDVGAGTVDLNVFLRRSRNERSPNEENPGLDYWSCEVEPLGFARLKVSEKRQKGIHEKAVNPIEKKQLIQRLNTCVNRLIKKAFKYQPYNTLSDGPSPWIGETMAYIWGGGAGHELYPRSFLDALRPHKLGIHNINRLPTPNETFRLPVDLKGNFGRLAIAYGLSYYHINLDNVTLPKELKYYEEIYPDLIEKINNKTKNCHCKGNPDCSYCLGSGYTNKNSLPINWNAIPNKQPTIIRSFKPIVKTKKTPKKVYQHNKKVDEKNKEEGHVLVIFIKCFNQFFNRKKIDQLNLVDQMLKWNKFRQEIMNKFPHSANMYIDNYLTRGCWDKRFIDIFGGAHELEKDHCKTIALCENDRITIKLYHKNPLDLIIALNAPHGSGNKQVLCSIIRDNEGEFILEASEPITIR